MREIFVLLILLSMTTCSGQRQAETMYLTGDDSGRTIELAAGQEFTITLSSNPTTGYGWALDDLDESVALYVRDEFKADKLTDNMSGSGGMHTWRFRATGPGEGLLRLEYKRSWEDKPPEEVFELNLRVK